MTSKIALKDVRLLIIGILGLFLSPNVVVASQKNVLFIVSDDLRPDIGAYAETGEGMLDNIHPFTPNLDELAAKSLLLKRAYVQQSICSPSRTSLMTGRRPDTTRVHDLYRYWRTVAGNFTTIPQYFKENGYNTIGMGKIFHEGHASGDNDPMSWSEDSYVPDDSYWQNYSTTTWHAADVRETELHPLVDMQVAQHAVETLTSVAPKALSGEQPFFIAVGFYKPHLPFLVPADYFDLYTRENISLPDNAFAPWDMPEQAWSSSKELRRYQDIGTQYGYGEINTTLPDDLVIDYRRAYYASVSYVDAMVGEVLNALELLGLADNTIVTFLGDHGFQLGEHGIWCKHTNFELAVRAPMMLRVPGLTDEGLVTDRLTEFVDLFPTLVEAADLPPVPLCPEDSSDVDLCTEGYSMMPLVSNPQSLWKSAVFSQYPRMAMSGDTVMGYRIRTDLYSYTQWVWYDTYRYIPTQPLTLFGEDLYDHTLDPEENINRVHDSAYAMIRQQLSDQLQAGWRGALPSAREVPQLRRPVSGQNNLL